MKFFGAARDNQSVQHIIDPFHRSFLSLLYKIIAIAKRANIPVGICGEFASDPLGAMLAVGMGAGSLSMSAPSIPIVKYVLMASDSEQLRKLAREAIRKRSGEMLEKPSRDRIRELASGLLPLDTIQALNLVETSLYK